MLHRLRVMPLALLLVVASASGQSEPPRTHDITLEDYFTLGFIAEFTVSPDGTRVTWIEGRWDRQLDRRNLDLWTGHIRTGEIQRLTFDPAAESAPQWSADGKWIYLQTSRSREGEDKPPYDGSSQVWRIAADGGELFPVTRVEGGVQGYQLSTDGNALYYADEKAHVEPDAWKDLRQEYSDLEYGHGVVSFGRISRLNLRTWRTDLLVDEDRVIAEFKVSDDERRIAMITTPTEKLITMEGWSHVDVFDTDTSAVTRLADHLWREEAPSPYGWIGGLCFSSDGAKLAFRVDFDGYPGEIFVAHFESGEVSISNVARPDGVTAEGQMAWAPRSHNLCILGDDHARARLIRIAGISPQGHGVARILTPGDEVVSAFGFSGSGADLVVLKSGLTHTPDLFLVRFGNAGVEYQRVTDINPQVNEWKLPQIGIVKWTSPDGTPVEGILELPPDYKKGDGPLPLVVSIHGGPTASSKYEFRYFIYGRTLFSAKGWAVFDPNYRGSTGYGDEFLIDLIRNKNNLDVQDIISGVDMLIAEGYADPERMAVTGWSNGGYLTNCLIVADQRFKAASSGAGVFDTVMQWSIEDTPGHVVNYSGGLPWAQASSMHATSPLYNIDKVTTPTLVHVGENDARVPAEHSRALHRSLHHYLDVPCELVVYPGEGHGLTTYTHRKAKLAWDHRWFEHWVLGKSSADE